MQSPTACYYSNEQIEIPGLVDKHRYMSVSSSYPDQDRSEWSDESESCVWVIRAWSSSHLTHSIGEKNDGAIRLKD